MAKTPARRGRSASDPDRIPPETRALLTRYGFEAERFEALRGRIRDGTLTEASNIVTGTLEAPTADAWSDLPKREAPDAREALEQGRAALQKGEVGFLVLNGGMATRFGGVVKGVVEALPGRSFLALKMQDAMREARAVGGRVPVYLMNSFATEAATLEHFAKHKNFGVPADDLHFYNQGIGLRLTPKAEIFLDGDGKPSCYGPGHGDCTTFLRRSGCLQQFLAAGGRYLFLSNVDNLAARLDPLVIGMHILSGQDLTAEVAPKWLGDKGGAPVYVDGQLWVVEGFRFPKDFDQDRIPVFNTNTFTVNARAIDRDFDLTPCYVLKDVDGGPAVQIETLVGELTRFLPTSYLRVKRTGPESRFFPIKTPQDLEDGREDLQAICGTAT
jgi:UTP--glucose-1-phosphate uridylyltransferase